MNNWSAVEARCCLDHVREDRLFAAWRLAASTGLRRGELLGLRWRDVDLHAGRVSVRQTLTTVGSKVASGEPKTAPAGGTSPWMG
jgi:integrase